MHMGNVYNSINDITYGIFIVDSMGAKVKVLSVKGYRKRRKERLTRKDANSSAALPREEIDTIKSQYQIACRNW